jgi:hypothetical protein
LLPLSNLMLFPDHAYKFQVGFGLAIEKCLEDVFQGLLILGSEESDPRNNTKQHETSDAEFVLLSVISWTAVLSLWQNDV